MSEWESDWERPYFLSEEIDTLTKQRIYVYEESGRTEPDGVIETIYRVHVAVQRRTGNTDLTWKGMYKVVRSSKWLSSDEARRWIANYERKLAKKLGGYKDTDDYSTAPHTRR